MIQQQLQLIKSLKKEVQDCDELWVAVALMSESGFRFLNENTRHIPLQHYLIGIDLPTPPIILKALQQKSNDRISSRVYYKPDKFFHPKVYLIRNGGRLVAFLGSGNCTQGGMEKNMEFNVRIEDEEFCNGTLKWFRSIYKHGMEITDEFLEIYTPLYKKRLIRIQQDKYDIKLHFPSDLEVMDFTYQFFKREHFEAFSKDRRKSRDDWANLARNKVRDQLFKLHDKLYPLILAKDWGLYRHYIFSDTVSSAVHGYTSAELGGIWLHYGRDKPEIKELDPNGTPLDFMRLQVIVHEDNIGISNRVGKDEGSKIDRDYLRKKMSTDPDFVLKFYSAITALPENYFIRLNNEKRMVSSFEEPKKLAEFILTDNIKCYFVIGVEFSPDDTCLSEQNIVSTVLEHFELLMPTYNLIKYPLFN